MDSIRLETKELLMYHCGCYSNLVTIATLYVADAYRSKEPLYQNRKNDLTLTMTPEQDKTLELSKHWSADSTPNIDSIQLKIKE